MPFPKFIFAEQDLNPPIDGINPPIDSTTTTFTIPTGIDYGSPAQTTDFVLVAVAVMIAAIIGVALWWYYDSKKRIKLEDIRPSTTNMSTGDISLNKAALMQMLPYMPPLIGITPVLVLAKTEPLMALVILLGLISLPALMYFYMKAKALEDNKGKVNMVGFLRRKDGDREQYFWREVEFKTESHLTDEELAEIDAAKVCFKEYTLKEIEAREAKRKEFNKGKKKEDQIPLVHEKDVYTRENIDSVHAIPIRVSNKHDAFLMSLHLKTEWEFVKGEDYDYYGYHEVQVTGPELREIATVHRVIELEAEEHRDEYCPVFLVMYDDTMSKKALGAIAPIDVTRDHAVAGLCKAIGAEERTTAGELNSITEQVMVLENEDKDLDDLSQTIGRKKALDFLNSEKRLTMFDLGMMGSVSTVVAIVFSVVMFLLGWSLGG